MSDFASTPGTSQRLKGFDGPSVWSEFTPLAQEYKSINLGQGFPDWNSPQFVKDAMLEAINDNHNQYTRSAGDISLVTALANHYGKLINREINPMTEVAITVGASQAIFGIMQALVNLGDEVLLVEPAFDIYPAAVQMAGGTCKFVSLIGDPTTHKWTLDMVELEKAITPKTKILLINTPHNPTGKVFSLEEMNQIADIVRRHPHVVAVTDEVYEKLVYDGKEHIRLASLPGMWERTLSISSAGKTFSATGWKVGWVYGGANLIHPLTLANQWIHFCVSTPAQKALAKILERSDQPYEGHSSYYDYIRSLYENKRNHLMQTLTSCDIACYRPEGGFFVIGDTSQYVVPENYITQSGPDGVKQVTRDWGFARWLTVECGITPIPPSAFYTQETKHQAANMARFAFCKQDDQLEAARKKFSEIKKK